MMPQMSAAFAGWKQKLTVAVVCTNIVDGFPEVCEKLYNVQGTVQPLSPEEIILKPDGQRSWEWMQVHIENGRVNLKLKTDDRIVIDGVKYKVMARKDYSRNNYIEYHVIQDFAKK